MDGRQLEQLTTLTLTEHALLIPASILLSTGLREGGQAADTAQHQRVAGLPRAAAPDDSPPGDLDVTLYQSIDAVGWSIPARQVGWGFLPLCALAYM